MSTNEDIYSDASFVKVDHRFASLPPPKPNTMLTKDGKVPEVVYSVKYIGGPGCVVDTIQSLDPFDKIPEFKKSPPKPSFGKSGPEPSVGKPVLEIVTSVHLADPSTPFIKHDRSSYVLSKLTTKSETQDVAMNIYSEHLINAVCQVTGYYPDFEVSDNSLTVPAPYQVLIHKLDALEAYMDPANQPSYHCDNDYAETTSRHIKILLDVLDRLMGQVMNREKELYSRNTPVATFANFWMLLKPGEIIYSKRDGFWNAYVVSSVMTQVRRRGTVVPYYILCWYMAASTDIRNASDCILRYSTSFTIEQWAGELPIRDCTVVPARFFPENPEEQQGLSMLDYQIKLGKLYWNLLKQPTYMEYEGPLVRGSDSFQFQGPTGFMQGRVVCDMRGYEMFKPRLQRPVPNPASSRPTINNGIPINPPVAPLSHPVSANTPLPQYQSQCGCDLCHRGRSQSGNEELIPGKFYGFEGCNPTTKAAPENDTFYAVLDKVMPAFLLNDRNWGLVSLAYLRSVHPDRYAFDCLVLDASIKRTIKALVGEFTANNPISTDSNAGGLLSSKRISKRKSHSGMKPTGQVSPWANDFVRNKGEGRICLLHGNAGVGKTATAECVAEFTGRPLLSLTSGDLGVVPESVESNLSYFLELGTRYGALVLLDEADVYLERRSSNDISRNGLVSIFLRSLEYYRGVLFLTTNRVGVFDDAFTSRVHVALHYNDLTKEAKQKIWTHSFDRLERDSKGHVQITASAREYVVGGTSQDLAWNGREIRNGLQTALALAEADAKNEAFCDDSESDVEGPNSNESSETTITEREEEAEKIVVALTEEHIRTVVEMRSGFMKFIKTDQGGKNHGESSANANEDNESLEDINSPFV